MFLSYTITQPYYLYIENLLYNVIPGIITLTFDSPPSSNPADYGMIAVQGLLMYTTQVGFSPIGNTFAVSGNTVSLTVPINMDTNCRMQFYYQGTGLPFNILCAQDPSFETPAIFEGFAYTLPL